MDSKEPGDRAATFARVIEGVARARPLLYTDGTVDTFRYDNCPRPQVGTRVTHAQTAESARCCVKAICSADKTAFCDDTQQEEHRSSAARRVRDLVRER